jgi:hypothetical protein
MRRLGGLLLGIVAASASATERPPAEAAARARRMAAILEVQPLVERILEEPAGSSVQEQIDRIRLHQQAEEEIGRVSLMIDGALARLQREQFAAASAHRALSEAYQGTVTNWNIAAVIIGSGATVVGTAMQFGDSTETRIGDGIIIGGAALAAAFSIVALVKKSRGPPLLPIETNCLAGLFGRAPTRESELPKEVWRYLDAPLPGDSASFRSQLVERFAKEGSLSLGSSPEARHKIDLLTRPISQREVIAASMLDLRARMLDDLRTRVAGMKDDLQLLNEQVQAHP